jgi:hypothetical protein
MNHYNMMSSMRSVRWDTELAVIRKRLPTLMGHVANIDIRAVTDDVSNEMALEMSAYLAAREQTTLKSYRYIPKTWWDHLKERWFPRWALHRWPVQRERLELLRCYYRTCHHLPFDPQDPATHVAWLAGEIDIEATS